MWNNESDRILSSDTNCDVVNALHKMRSSNVLCDVVLAVSFKTKSVSGDGKNLSSLRAVVAHRAILVAASPYFYRLYEDKRLRNVLWFPNVTLDGLLVVLDYIYGQGLNRLSKDNVENVLNVGRLFEIELVQTKCQQLVSEQERSLYDDHLVQIDNGDGTITSCPFKDLPHELSQQILPVLIQTDSTDKEKSTDHSYDRSEMSVQQMSKRVVTSNDDVTELSVEESEAPIDTNFILSLLGFKSPLEDFQQRLLLEEENFVHCLNGAYFCPVCSFFCARLQRICDHVKTRHDYQVRSLPTLKCKVGCGYETYEERNLIIHTKTKKHLKIIEEKSKDHSKEQQDASSDDFKQTAVPNVNKETSKDEVASRLCQGPPDDSVDDTNKTAAEAASFVAPCGSSGLGGRKSRRIRKANPKYVNDFLSKEEGSEDNGESEGRIDRRPLGEEADGLEARPKKRMKKASEEDRKALVKKNGLYLCQKCGQAFKYRLQLCVHLKKKHFFILSSLLEKCSLCDYSSFQQSRIIHHMNAVHENQTPFDCSKCDKSYAGMRELRSHVRCSHGPRQMFVCDVCDVEFRSIYGVRAHQSKEHGADSQPQLCPYCDYRTIFSGKIEEHLSKKHGVESSLIEKYRCDICGYTSFRKHQVEKHVQFSHGDLAGAVICPQCGKGLKNSACLSSHMKMKHTEKQQSCKHCDRSFTLARDLKTHTRIMHTERGIRPFRCAYCDYASNVRYGALRHMRRLHPNQPLVVVFDVDASPELSAAHYGNSETPVMETNDNLFHEQTESVGFL